MSTARVGVVARRGSGGCEATPGRAVRAACKLAAASGRGSKTLTTRSRPASVTEAKLLGDDLGTIDRIGAGKLGAGELGDSEFGAGKLAAPW